MKFTTTIALIFSCCGLLSLQAEDVRDNATGETFPKQVSFSHDGKDYQLECTGVATRRKLIIKVYSVASYLQTGASGADKFQLFTQDDLAKQLTLKYVHDVPAAKVTDAYQESFKNAFAGSDYAQQKNDIDKYIQLFNRDVKKGDQQIIRWLPGGYIEVIINGQNAGNLTNKALAKALWSIWFGDHSVVDRNKLVSLMQETAAPASR
ncbi:MAG: chalcone isomerase family protein [Parachlamydia sp.]|nr:chalcone isomerase family protein [Parachlamydia sp.]